MESDRVDNARRDISRCAHLTTRPSHLPLVVNHEAQSFLCAPARLLCNHLVGADVAADWIPHINNWLG